MNVSTSEDIRAHLGLTENIVEKNPQKKILRPCRQKRQLLPTVDGSRAIGRPTVGEALAR